jgi:hypothetical protein
MEYRPELSASDGVLMLSFQNLYQDMGEVCGGSSYRTHSDAIKGRSKMQKFMGVEVCVVHPGFPRGRSHTVIGVFSDAELRKWNVPRL